MENQQEGIESQEVVNESDSKHSGSLIVRIITFLVLLLCFNVVLYIIILFTIAVTTRTLEFTSSGGPDYGIMAIMFAANAIFILGYFLRHFLKKKQ